MADYSVPCVFKSVHEIAQQLVPVDHAVSAQLDTSVTHEETKYSLTIRATWSSRHAPGPPWMLPPYLKCKLCGQKLPDGLEGREPL